MSGRSEIRVIHVDDEADFAELAADMLEREDDRFSIEISITPAVTESRSDGVCYMEAA